MMDQLYHQLIADALLILHGVFIAFVILGLLAVLIAIFRKWQWAKNPWFRSTHLLAITLVVTQAWAGIICPLTIWEMQYREKAGQVVYAGSFIQHWLHKLIFFQAEAWVFALCYTVFGLAVLASWYFYPPTFRKQNNS